MAPFARPFLGATLVPLVLAGAVILPLGLRASRTAWAASAPSTARQTASPRWITYNPATRTAHLTLISAYGQDTFNFNGGSAGHFVVKVPVNSRVIVTYSNMSPMMPHGAEVVPWTGTLPTGKPPAPAFPGAASPDYLHGTHKGITQTFAFTATKAGKYLLICPVKNHVKLGHWAWFIVSRAAATATARLNP